MSAFVFPGQGAQKVGMGKSFFEQSFAAKKLFLEADRLLGFSLSNEIFSGSAEKLKHTDLSQLALFVTAMATLSALQEALPGLQPGAVAGLSLGEYSALVAAEVLTFRDALLLVRRRGELMARACDETNGAMVALLGFDYERAEEVVSKVDNLWIANENCPGQIVLSGTEAALQKGVEMAKTLGAKRARPLAVHGAFHSGLMSSAAEQLAHLMAETPFQDAACPVVVNGESLTSGKLLCCYMQKQITSPVRFVETIYELERLHCDTFVEFGPSGTVSGLVRKTLPSATRITVDKFEELELLERTLGANVSG